MTDSKRLTINTMASAAQVVVTTILLLIVYDYLIERLGPQDFGAWALVLAWTSATSIANLGIATGVVRFVAQYRARNEPKTVADIIQTAILSLAVILGLALILLYPLLDMLLRAIVEPASAIPSAILVLPYAVVSFWLTSLAMVVTSALDGQQRMYLRSIIMIAASAGYLVAVVMLVPLDGLLGLAHAQVLQSTLLLGTAWVGLRAVTTDLPIVPFRWRSLLFKELVGYGARFQLIALFQMLLEPTTKSLLSKVSGVSVVSLFELANRVAVQLRSIAIAAQQALVPTIAELDYRDPGRVRDVYVRWLRLVVVVVTVSVPLLILASPILSIIWLGSIEPLFLVFASIVSVGWFANMLSAPAYFSNLGTARLRWNIFAHLIIAVANVALGIGLGLRHGAVGIVFGFGAALAVGSAVLLFVHHRANHVVTREFLDRPTCMLALSAALAGVCGLGCELLAPVAYRVPVAATIVVSYVALVSILAFRHPEVRLVRERIWRLMRRVD